MAFAKTAWTTKTCWNHKPNPGPWKHYTGKCIGKLNQPNHGIFHVISTTHLITWSNWTGKISKIPLFVRPKLRICTWHPTLSLPASKRATRGLNKHLSTLHSRSIALNLSLPSIKQKRDQNKKSNVLLVAYTSVTQWIFGHFLGVTVKYTSIYNDCCWAHLGTFVSFMFWSSSPPVPGELAPQLWEQLLRTTWVKFNRGFVWPKQVKQTFPRACMGLDLHLP